MSLAEAMSMTPLAFKRVRLRALVSWLRASSWQVVVSSITEAAWHAQGLGLSLSSPNCAVVQGGRRAAMV